MTERKEGGKTGKRSMNKGFVRENKNFKLTSGTTKINFIEQFFQCGKMITVFPIKTGISLSRFLTLH